jgi:hypothetical protein
MEERQHSARNRADRRALVATIAAVAVFAVTFRATQARVFAGGVYVALGGYVLRFAVLSYREPDETIGAWPRFYWYLRPGAPGSRRFIRAAAMFWFFAGMLSLVCAAKVLWFS